MYQSRKQEKPKFNLFADFVIFAFYCSSHFDNLKNISGIPNHWESKFLKVKFREKQCLFFLNFVLTKTSNIDLVQEQGQNTNYEKKSMD